MFIGTDNKPAIQENRTVKQLINDGLPQELAELLGSKTKEVVADILDGGDNGHRENIRE